jgi:uncharacterized protein YcbX
MHLASIHVYPLKGARGIALPRADVRCGGLRHDRRFMLIDLDGRMLTQRSHPQLALVTTSLQGGALTIGVPGAAPIELPARPDGPRRTASIWKDHVDAIEVESEIVPLLAAHLGAPCALVFMPDDAERQVDLRFGAPGDRVGFADGYPLLLATFASLAELGARLDAPVPMDRFRPNLVVAGGEPFEEERYGRVRVGAVELRMPKRCARCEVTNVDQATAARGAEPLRTLATYRAMDNNVYFAQNLIPDGEGAVALGDAITYLDER